MTQALDTKFAAKAIQLVNRFGRNTTFTVPSGTYDPATGSFTGVSADPKVWKATAPSEYELKYVDGTTVLMGDAQMTVAASGITFAPVVDTLVVSAGENWKIVSVRPLSAIDDIVAYEFQIRRVKT